MEDAGTTDHPRHGCMDCKATTADTVEHLTNGNTIWRCVGCGHVSRLIPGKSLRTRETAGTLDEERHQWPHRSPSTFL